MANDARIAVFYSPGHDYADALRRVKETWPGQTVVAWVPAGYEPTPTVAALADEIRHTQRERYGLRDLPAVIALLREFRAARYGRFVVLFDSAKLRLLAALSKAHDRAHCPPRGTPVPLPGSPLKVVFQETRRLLQAHATNLYIQLAVRLLKTHRP